MQGTLHETIENEKTAESRVLWLLQNIVYAKRVCALYAK